MKHPHQLYCVETDRQFFNLRQAAEFFGVKPSSIYNALNNGTRIKGYHLRYGKSKDFEILQQVQKEDIFEECFQKWYTGEQQVDDAMIEQFVSYGLCNRTPTVKNSIYSRFHKECIKREMPIPSKARFHYKCVRTKSTQKHTAKTWHKAYSLWTEYGWTQEDIADELGVSTKTVYRHLKELKGG